MTELEIKIIKFLLSSAVYSENAIMKNLGIDKSILDKSFKILEEKKKIFNSENDKVVILSKENTYCKKDSILDEMFPYNEFNREKITDNEIIKILEEISEEVKNI